MYVSEVRLKFTPNFRLLGICLVFVPLLTGLGFWQLERAHEKEQLQQQLSTLSQVDPVDYTDILSMVSANATSLEKLNYMRIKMSGHYRPDAQWLLENQMLQGRPGYHILTLFQLDGGYSVIVNRGWLESMDNRQQLPDIKTPVSKVTVSGIIKVPSAPPFLSYEPENISKQKIIAKVDLDKMGEEVNKRLEPVIIYLDQISVGSFIEDKPVISIQPEKHTGYAVQWFSMAFVLFLLTLYTNSNFSTWIRYKK